MAQFRSPVIPGILIFIFCLPTASRFIQFNREYSKPHTRLLKVTSYNSMLFDLYNWTKNRESRADIFSSLIDINPDIICLQEFYTSEQEGDFNNTDTLKSLLKTPYFHSEYTITLRDFDHWGIATFSKYPIINEGKINFNTRTNNICIFSDIVINKDTLRIYNVHLQSIGFSKNDHLFLEEVLSEKVTKNEVSNSKNILRRLKKAFLLRTSQVDMISLHMKTCPYPIIICGDFNDTAASYAYERLSKGMKDAFDEKGLGFGITYAGKWPQFRIDYILHDKQLKCAKYLRSDETFTDHYPITAYFESPNKNK
jgi:endonuclease/exonuclease/phosphatase family metal-dependent hydrolase